MLIRGHFWICNTRGLKRSLDINYVNGLQLPVRMVDDNDDDEHEEGKRIDLQIHPSSPTR